MTSSAQLPDLTGRTAIVTGATSGIGAAVATALAGRGAHVVFAVRDPAKGEQVAAATAAATDGTTEVRRLDLANLHSVRAFAADWNGPVDLLVNNAGLFARSRRHTTDGFELQVGTNYLGPFALTNLLLPHLTGRVVSLASQAERSARLDLDDLGGDQRPYRPSRAYANSKLAILLFTRELQRRLVAVGSGVLALAAHPGFVATRISAGSSPLTRLTVRLLAQAPDAGALPVLYAAVGHLPGGSFTGPEHLAHMRGGAQLIGRSRTARDDALAGRLWAVSEQLTAARFPL